MINEYDEIKRLLKRSRMLMEQPEGVNIAKSIENEISKDDKEYETSGDGQTDSDDSQRFILADCS